MGCCMRFLIYNLNPVTYLQKPKCLEFIPNNPHAKYFSMLMQSHNLILRWKTAIIVEYDLLFSCLCNTLFSPECKFFNFLYIQSRIDVPPRTVDSITGALLSSFMIFSLSLFEFMHCAAMIIRTAVPNFLVNVSRFIKKTNQVIS